jgi:hypothetical protein
MLRVPGFSIVIAGHDPAIHAKNLPAQSLREASYAGRQPWTTGSSPVVTVLFDSALNIDSPDNSAHRHKTVMRVGRISEVSSAPRLFRRGYDFGLITPQHQA